MGSASTKELEGLHALVAKVLKTELTAERTDENGEVIPVSPQLLSQAIKFLKDNGIEPAKDVNNAALDALAQEVKDALGNPEKLQSLIQ